MRDTATHTIRSPLRTEEPQTHTEIGWSKRENKEVDQANIYIELRVTMSAAADALLLLLLHRDPSTNAHALPHSVFSDVRLVHVTPALQPHPC